jgi:4-hydroxy-tetrahydrodipicolinate synthase
MLLKRDVYAAALVPRDRDGRFDEINFRAIVSYLAARQIDGIVINGATGEYCQTSEWDLLRMLAICREVLGSHGQILCGIGAPSLPRSIELGRIAMEAGAKALLLPMPYFFRYAQEDLSAYCRAAAAALESPILLYNLPVFTNPLQLTTVRDLLASVPNLVGIKDSSGSLEILAGLSGTTAVRIVGDDSVLVAALDAGVCDCVISGVAGVLPELMKFLFHERRSASYPQAAQWLDELVKRLSVFPTPWGLKLIAECRGMAEVSLTQPLSDNRVAEACAFRAWFGEWWPHAYDQLLLPTAAQSPVELHEGKQFPKPQLRQ